MAKKINMLLTRDSIQLKLQDLKKAFEELTTKLRETKLFTKTIIDPSFVFEDADKAELGSFLRSFCSSQGKADKIEECKLSEDKQIKSLTLLDEAEQAAELGLVETKLRAQSSHAEQVDRILDLIDAARKDIKKGNRIEEKKELDHLTSEFRKTVESLYAEFAGERAADKNEYGLKAGKVRSSPLLAWKQDCESTSSTEIALYDGFQKPTIVEPIKSVGADVKSEDAVKAVRSQGYHTSYAIVSLLSTQMVVEFVLPAQIQFFCHVLKGSKNADFKASFNSANIIEEAKTATENYFTIFQGFETDHHRDIASALADIASLKIGENGFDSTSVGRGLHDLMQVIVNVGHQHGQNHDFGYSDILEICKEHLSAENVLQIAGSDAKGANQAAVVGDGQ